MADSDEPSPSPTAVRRDALNEAIKNREHFEHATNDRHSEAPKAPPSDSPKQGESKD